jgi:FtsP/CotA-like multicopper oxidase with cupredoxin domain
MVGVQSQDQKRDLSLMLSTDWYPQDYFVLVKELMAPNRKLPFSENNLINGKMTFDCAKVEAGDNATCTGDAGLSKFRFTNGKTHRLRLVNSGAEPVQRFSIDGHVMTVIANDFVPIQPYNTTVVTLGVGQRADVLVHADGPRDGVYWMRSNMTSCSLTHQPNALAVVYYDDADTNAVPTSTPWDVPDPGNCANDDLGLTHPAYALPLPEPDVTKEFVITVGRNASNITVWAMNGIPYRGNYNAPPLLLARTGNFTYDHEWAVHDFGSSATIRIVVINNSSAAHPMHLHGFNMYVLYEGPGLEWDGTIINPENPQRRDVQLVRAHGHVVLQFDAADNPGMWPFHCHIAWHASAGFFSQFLIQADKVQQMQIPHRVNEVCHEWGEWTKTNIPDQIDSGL